MIRSRFVRFTVCLAALGFVLALASGPAPVEARGGAAAPPPAADPNQQLGARLFDQCIHWVARGSQGITRTTDFYIQVIAELDLDTTRHRGPMRIWWKAPDKYRQELTTGGRTTTKILNNEFMWIIHPTGQVQRMHGTPEGANAIKQLKEDRSRMADLAQFITLRSLKGPGVTFTFAGEKPGSGEFEGPWVKVSRTVRGATAMHFWLAYDRDPRGGYVAKWPGIVRIDGDPRQRIPTETFLLRSWVDSPPNQPRAYRFPTRIDAFSQHPQQPMVRFLRAQVQDIKINTAIPDSRFRAPLPGRR